MSSSLLEGFRRLTPRMAGTTFRDRALACAGAVLGIGIAGIVCGMVAGSGFGLPLLVAPLGASAVLLFAVPASPLAQPWSIVGGNTISALIGVAAAQAIPNLAIAAAVAVGAAIGIMSIARCLHPPGGAVALSAVVGGPAVAVLGYGFAAVPVGINSLALVILGLAFHRFSGHSYPHRPKAAIATGHGTADPPPQARVALSEADIDAALADSGENFDIARDDLIRLVRKAEVASLERTSLVPRCADIMSRDIVSITGDAPWQAAHALLLQHDLRILPVIDGKGVVIGIVELHERDKAAMTVAEAMSEAVTALPDASILDLVEVLSSGRHHAVPVVDAAGRLRGLITQTDMIAALARLAVAGAVRGK